MKIETEKTKSHACGCLVRKEGNRWIMYKPCKEHEKKNRGDS